MTFTVTGIIIVLILVILFILGTKDGLIKAVFDLLSFFLTWALTWLFYPHVSGMIIKTPVYTGIAKWCEMTLSSNPLMTETIPEFFADLPPFIKESIITSSKQGLDSIVASTSEALAVLLVNAVSIIGLYILFRLISLLIRKLGEKINKILLIGPVNMILGGIFGLVKGIFVVYIAVMIISFFPTTKVYDIVKNDINSDKIICGTLFNEDAKLMGFSVRYPQ